MGKVHRLVAQAFIPNPKNYPIINHKDENPSNNHINNLEWCTLIYNRNYGTANERLIETRNRNKTHGMEKPILQYNFNGELVNKYRSAQAAAREFNKSASHIISCALGKRQSAYGYIWRYEEDNIPIPKARKIVENPDGTKKYYTKTTGFGVTKRKAI